MDRDEVRAHLGCKIDPIAAGQLEQLVRRHARNSQEARDSTASILRFGQYVEKHGGYRDYPARCNAFIILDYSDEG